MHLCTELPVAQTFVFNHFRSITKDYLFAEQMNSLPAMDRCTVLLKNLYQT